VSKFTQPLSIMIKDWYISCKKATVWAQTKNDTIIDCAPFVWKFKGQPLDNLLKWLTKFGPVKSVDISNLLK